MSRADTTYLEACLAGEALLDDVDDWVDAWHDAMGAPRGKPESLEYYLGFNDTEYSLWTEKPSLLRVIVAARKRHVSIEDIHSESSKALAAARSNNDHDAVRLLQWLKTTGRIQDS